MVRFCRSIARGCNVEVIDPLENDGNQGGLPRDVKITRTIEYGTVQIIEALWEQYGIGKTIRKQANKKKIPYDKALIAMVASRLCSPKSKLGVWDRWLETVYLPQCNDFKLRQMY